MCGRSFFGVGTFILYTWSLENIPIALASILFNLSPFWTSILAFLLNDEKILAVEFFAMGICFVLIICMTTIGPKEAKESNESMVSGTIIMVVASIISACMNVMNRRL
jgi:drug/metabolite transporter (DMT)-like permease